MSGISQRYDAIESEVQSSLDDTRIPRIANEVVKLNYVSSRRGARGARQEWNNLDRSSSAKKDETMERCVAMLEPGMTGHDACG